MGLIVFLGCSRPADVPEAKKAEPLPVVSPKRQSLKRTVEQPGVVQADEESNLFGRVGGYVKAVRVDIGQAVRGPKFDSAGKETEPGETLAEIAVPELEAEESQKIALVKQATAEVEQAKQALASAEAAIGTAEGSLAEAKALSARWDSELKRITGLVQSGVIDAQTRDETTNQSKAAQARVQSTEAAVRKAKADRDKAEADVTTAQAHVSVAEADARRIAATLSYAKIRAPFDGVVTRRKINVGDIVHATPGKADALVTVARLDPVRVVVAIPEADADFIREKTEAKLSIPALSMPPMASKVSRLSWALEPGSRTLRAEFDVPNPERRLRPGMYVSARLSAPLPEAWTLPATAVIRQGEQTVCFQIQNGKAVRTPVQTGRTDGLFTEIITPIFTGEERIAGRAVGLVDGQMIEEKR